MGNRPEEEEEVSSGDEVSLFSVVLPDWLSQCYWSFFCVWGVRHPKVGA